MADSRRQWIDPFSETCSELVEAHYPFSVVFPEESGPNRRFSVPELDRFERVVVPEGTVLKGKDKAIVESLTRQERAVPWTGPKSALGGIEPMVHIDEGKRLWVFPRKNKKNPVAPVVFHLFNPCYDAEHDSMIEQTNIVMSLRSDLSDGHVEKAVVRTPYEEHRELSVRTSGGRIDVTIPKLTLWGILSLE